MSKRTVFTTITPLPPIVTREHVLTFLHDHVGMIDLNPLVTSRVKMERPPPQATPEEFHSTWYLVTDKVSYLPGISSSISYPACFHDLSNGIQTHIYAPLGLEIRGKWTLGGTLESEPVQPVEMGLGVPLKGLYVREDVDMRCNLLMTGFVKKTLKNAHAELVARLSVKAQITGAKAENERVASTYGSPQIGYQGSSVGSAAGTPTFAPQMGFASPPGSPPPPGYQHGYGQSYPSPGLPWPAQSSGFQGQMGQQRDSYGQQQGQQGQRQKFAMELSADDPRKQPMEMPADVPRR